MQHYALYERLDFTTYPSPHDQKLLPCGSQKPAQKQELRYHQHVWAGHCPSMLYCGLPYPGLQY